MTTLIMSLPFRDSRWLCHQANQTKSSAGQSSFAITPRRQYRQSMTSGTTSVWSTRSEKTPIRSVNFQGAALSPPTEFDLYLVVSEQSLDTPLSRDYLTQTLRGIEYDGIDRTIDNKVVRLRKILGDDHTPAEKFRPFAVKAICLFQPLQRQLLL